MPWPKSRGKFRDNAAKDRLQAGSSALLWEAEPGAALLRPKRCQHTLGEPQQVADAHEIGRGP